MPAHDLHDQQTRTEDVALKEDTTFANMMLSDKTLKGLTKHGFKKPSPIQYKAIPLGRCGLDLIVKAKSGTGKTCVFGVIALEMISTKINALQVLILAPTREIAYQVSEVLNCIGDGYKKLKIHSFFGGTPVQEDKVKLAHCHIAVGSPGRVKHLISANIMNTASIRLFVLDEADKLMEESYQKDINYIFSSLPESKQIVATSATYTTELEEFLSKYMRSPVKVTPSDDVILLGIQQFVTVIPSAINLIKSNNDKCAELQRILSSISFRQCLVFCNLQARAELVCKFLIKEGWPAAFLSGAQTQNERLSSLEKLKKFTCRVLITTDLASRGIDAENVNLIINLDIPVDPFTYLHRIGRAGRYGTQGISITFVQLGDELKKFQIFLSKVGGASFSVLKLPNKIPRDIWTLPPKSFEKLYASPSVEEPAKEEPAANYENLQQDYSNCLKDIFLPFTKPEPCRSLEEIQKIKKEEENVKVVDEQEVEDSVQLLTNLSLFESTFRNGFEKKLESKSSVLGIQGNNSGYSESEKEEVEVTDVHKKVKRKRQKDRPRTVSVNSDIVFKRVNFESPNMSLIENDCIAASSSASDISEHDRIEESIAISDVDERNNIILKKQEWFERFFSHLRHLRQHNQYIYYMQEMTNYNY